ncbi:MAG: aldehyde ferredoxin oxidoreductase family protein [Candidatus Bathyarchaeia archaeon]
MIFGYAGKIAHIELTSSKILIEDLDQAFARKFVGGRGFAAKLLYDNLKPGIDPLSPENVLIFTVGPFTGTLIPKGSRYSISAKSPLTGGYMDSEGGGHIGPAMKFAGFDALVIKGKSPSPKYIFLSDGKIELRDASHIWNKPIDETEEIIREEVGDHEVKIAAIGPAGERLVRFACITNDLHRHAGRCGGGAVMGSKNIKAIAAIGSRSFPIANLDGFKKVVDEMLESTIGNPAFKSLREFGTWGGIGDYNNWGVHPTRNYRTTYFESWEKLFGKNFKPRIFLSDRACFACPIACGKHIKVKEGAFKGTMVEGPEYETITMLGSNCGIDSIEAIARANQLCDSLGLDTISTGNAIGFAMELYERGILTSEDTEGMELTFGNSDAMVKLVEMIAYRRGIGDILAEGVKRASERIGKNSQKYAVHVKGLEMPAYDARGAIGQGLAFAVADLGGTHDRAWTIGEEVSNPNLDRFSPEGKAELVIKSQRMRTLPDILGYCRFILLDFSKYAEALAMLTGWDVSAEELIQSTDRIFTLTRMFNLREGFTREDDDLPQREKEPIESGPMAGRYIKDEDLQKMINDYYRLRGWDEKGVPKKETLKQLGLEDFS